MAQFYGTKIEPDEKCASFGTRLEQKLNQVSLQYPNKISESMYWNYVRERFFHGLSKDMRTTLELNLIVELIIIVCWNWQEL